MRPHFYQSFVLSVLMFAGTSHAQTITTFAGIGSPGYNGDERSAISTQLWGPGGLAISGGTLYFADGLNNRLRRITIQSGTVVTLAGNDNPDNTGDGGPATDAQLNDPEAVAMDGQGNIYIADKYNNSIRKITPKGVISTYAGSGQSGYSGDGGAAIAAQLNAPGALAVDYTGNVFITDAGNNCIRKVTTDGKIMTVAGTGKEGFKCDSCSATTALLNSPKSIAVDTAGNLYIADALNYRIRKVTPAGLITTIAGGETSGFSGDGEAATAAKLNMPTGVVIDRLGNIYIADQGNNRIREINTQGIISTVAGGGIDSTNQLSAPYCVAVDGNGVLYVSEQQNNLIKKVIPAPPASKVVKNTTKTTTPGKAYTPPPFSTPGASTPPPSYRSGAVHPSGSGPGQSVRSGKGR